MDLNEIRAGIDGIDQKIIELLAQRAALVGQAATLKKNEQGVRDPKRVEDVINRVKAHARRAGLAEEIAERTYRTLIGCFVEKELDAFRKSENRE